MKPILSLCIALGIILSLTSCGHNQKNGKTQESDYIKYSELLDISSKDDFTEVKVFTSASDKMPSATYILTERGKNIDIPSGPNVSVIEIPVSRLIIYSSVHAGALKELGKLDAITGVADSRYFKIPEIKAGLADRSISDIGQPESPSLEKIIACKPDGVMISLYEGMQIPEISSTGVEYIKMADNLESTPLGRAEWIKLLGLLTGEKEKADSIFRYVEKEYLTLKNIAGNVNDKPKILTDNLYQGVWYVPAGKSYQAALIADAGGEYPWSDTDGNGSLALSYEEIINKAADADIWLYKSFGNLRDKSDLLSIDPRYKNIKAIDNKGFWFSDTSKNTLYEDFPFHPEKLLKEYINIFHPGLLPDASLHYFKQI